MHAETLQAADGSSQRLATLLSEAAGAGLWRGDGGAALLADMRRGAAGPHQAWPLYEALVKHSASLLAPEQQVTQPILASTTPGGSVGILIHSDEDVNLP